MSSVLSAYIESYNYASLVHVYISETLGRYNVRER